MPDDAEPATTYTSTVAHLRGVTVTVTITVPLDSSIGHRIGYPDIQRIAAEGTAATLGNLLTLADDPPF